MATSNEKVNSNLRAAAGRPTQGQPPKPEAAGDLPTSVEEVRVIEDVLELESVASELAEQAAGLAEDLKMAATLASAAESRRAELEEAEGSGSGSGSGSRGQVGGAR